MSRFRLVSGNVASVVRYTLKETSMADSYELAKTSRGMHVVFSERVAFYIKSGWTTHEVEKSAATNTVTGPLKAH